MGDTGEESEDDDAEDVDANEDDEPSISLPEALRDPVYVVSLDPDARACILYGRGHRGYSDVAST